MSGNLTALASTWAGLSGSTTKKLAVINALTVVGPTVDIDLDAIENFLVTSNKIVGLRAFVNQTPPNPDAGALLAASYLLALLNGSDGPKLRAASQPGLLTILAGLSADARTGISAANVTALNAKCAPAVPWWQANGFGGPITVGDLIAAGNLF